MILPGLHNKWQQIVLSVLCYVCEIRPYCWVYLWLNHCHRWRILHSVTVPQFTYPLYWRWYLGCFYFGAINNRLPGIFLSLPDVFLKPGAGLPSLQEDCPLQWFTTFCLVSLHLLPLTWDAWHSFFFSLIQVDLVWGHGDAFGDPGRVPESFQNGLGATALTSCYDLEMLVPAALSHSPWTRQLPSRLCASWVSPPSCRLLTH